MKKEQFDQQAGIDWYNQLIRDFNAKDAQLAAKDAQIAASRAGYEQLKLAYETQGAQIAALRKALAEVDGCFEAALCEGWIDAIENGDLERIRDIWYRRISLSRSLLPAALEMSGGGSPDPAEAMRAKCEAIARGMEPHGWRSAAMMQERIAEAIAALKGNGEGR